MPEIDPADGALRSLTGIHLWHAPMSSCSQRVRIVLHELDQPFESHEVNLGRDEHASQAYQKIHPDGLVPALVHDGRLFIESVDIIQHLAADHATLRDQGDADVLQAADAAQKDLKLLSFEFLFRARAQPSAEKADAFDKGHGNAWLRQFRRDFAAGFDPARLNAAIARTDAGFCALDKRLSDGRDFLSGDAFSITDIAWMPNVHRMRLMDWPFDHTPHLARWFDRVRARPSYRAALLDWQGQGELDLFETYTAERQSAGSDVRSFPHFAGNRESQ